MSVQQKTVVVGAGPVGSLAALFAAQRGHEVEVYELRPARPPVPVFQVVQRRIMDRVLSLPPCLRLLLLLSLIAAVPAAALFPTASIPTISALDGVTTTCAGFFDSVFSSTLDSNKNVDLRNPGTIPLNFTKSINLAVSERGINAMRSAGHPSLLETVMTGTIPMRGRMIHGKSPLGDLYEHAQDYDAKGRAIYAIDRSGLNEKLLNVLDSMPNVKLFFNHKLTGADFRARRAWFEARDVDVSPNGRPREIEISFDLMIGADGAHSAVRYHMMKFTRMDYQQEYIDTLWCEFRIEPQEGQSHGENGSKFRISQNHLHIWPGRDFMFIAIPSEDGSFTSTLFLPSKQFAALENNPAQLPSFFDQYFPGVTDLIPGESLISSFQSNPHLPLISLKCRPYHYSSSAVIVGDAAHAMVPFYGQGMNAGMEDVRILFSIFDKHNEMLENNNSTVESHMSSPMSMSSRAEALAEYSDVRAPDAYAINELALQNYVEMRSSVLSMRYRLRKFLEEFMSVNFPNFGWQTKYSRVSFSNQGYSDIVRQSDHQGRILMRVFVACITGPVAAAFLIFGYRYRRPLLSTAAGILGFN